MNVRRAAGLAIKNTMTARDVVRLQELAREWMALDTHVRQQIKTMVLKTLRSTEARAGSIAALVIDAIAQIELPLGQWPDLIQLLLSNVTSETSTPVVKRSALEALGYICEGIDASILAKQSNEILTAVVSGARKEETSMDVRYAAMKAFYNSLDFIRSNFENDVERNYIMQVICEATQAPDARLQTVSLECLVEIMHLYYDKMEFYMDKALVGLTLQLLSTFLVSPSTIDETVALQAIEFWSTVCEEEIELVLARNDAIEAKETFTHAYYQFAQKYLSPLVPILTQLLVKSSDHGEDEDEDEEDGWNVHMSAATCLSLLANCVQDDIVSHVLPFVQQHIQNSTSSAHREAAVMAFGTILEGPSDIQLRPLASLAFPLLITLMNDSSRRVRDTTAWTLGRICELVPDAIQLETQPGALQALLEVLLKGLCDAPGVAANCAWALKNVAEYFGVRTTTTETTDMETSHASIALLPYIDGSIAALLGASGRHDSSQNNLRMAAYESLSTWVQYAPHAKFDSIQQLASVIMLRLRTSMVQTTALTIEERMQQAETLGELCGLMQAILRRLPALRIAPFADELMALFLSLFSSPIARTSGIMEDALLAVGSLMSTLESGFTRYVDSFLPILLAALANHAEHQVCRVAVGLVGDIGRALGEGVLPYCDLLITHLIQNLQSAQLPRDVKPPILSCFGDIALAINGHYTKYLEVTMTVLLQASQVRTEPSSSDDLMDYVMTLRECILEGYTGIIQGLKSGGMASTMLPYVKNMVQLAYEISMMDAQRTDALTRGATGLLGDIADSLGVQVAAELRHSWIEQLLRDARLSHHTPTKEVGKWASVIVRRVKAGTIDGDSMLAVQQRVGG